MGSSTRKIQEKIKKILNPVGSDGEPIELEKAIPAVIIETLRTKKTKRYFGDKDFLGLMQGGVASVQAIKGGSFREFINDESLPIDFEKSQELDEVTTEKVLEAILNKIESESDDIETALILRAFKITMSKLLMGKNIDISRFVFDFCCNVLFLIIMENITESMIDSYKDKNISDYDVRIRQLAYNWVEKNVKESIDAYSTGKISINRLIEDLMSKIESVKGDFNV